MLNKGDKNKILYLLLIIMLLFSLAIVYKQETESVQVGNFGSKNRQNNISFSDFGKKLFSENEYEI